jgi:uncharacterized membrane protein
MNSELSSTEDVDEMEGFRVKDDGYTPFEFLEFTNIPLKHEVSIWVDRPVADCYKIWDNRLNWMQWFEMIDEVGFHEEEPSYISMYLWYRWATTPFLELYVTLDRTQQEENKYILEEPVEGLPLVAAVLFQEGDEEAGGGGGGTTVTLRLSYLLPTLLKEFAGQLAVYGDVDKKLQKSMVKMKAFTEGIDLTTLDQVNKENEEQIRANFAEQRVLKARVESKKEDRVKRWEAVALAEEEAAEAGMSLSDFEEERKREAEETKNAKMVLSGSDTETDGEDVGNIVNEAIDLNNAIENLDASLEPKAQGTKTRRRKPAGTQQRNPAGAKKTGTRKMKAEPPAATAAAEA